MLLSGQKDESRCVQGLDYTVNVREISTKDVFGEFLNDTLHYEAALTVCPLGWKSVSRNPCSYQHDLSSKGCNFKLLYHGLFGMFQLMAQQATCKFTYYQLHIICEVWYLDLAHAQRIFRPEGSFLRTIGRYQVNFRSFNYFLRKHDVSISYEEVRQNLLRPTIA